MAFNGVARIGAIKTAKATVAALATGALALAAAASAQAQTANALNVSLDTISADEVAKMLTEFEIASEMRTSQTDGGAPVLLAETGGGGRFLVTFQKCANAALASGCSQATITTAQSSAGVAYDDINRFNGESTVTRVVYEASQQLLIFGRNVVMPGGVGRDNFKLQIALFLNDMGNFVRSRTASGTAISFGVTPSLKGKIDGLTQEGENPIAVRASVDKSSRDLEIEIAIENATGVTFEFENSPLDQ